MLLIGAVLYLAGALAWPGPVEAEPDLASTWVGETGAEPAAAILGDQRSSTPLELALTGNDAAAVPDADLWAEFFTSPPSSMSARNVPASQPPVGPRPASRRGAAATSAPPTFRIQQNDHVQHFLTQYQTGYRREVVERWLARSGAVRPIVVEGCRQK